MLRTRSKMSINIPDTWEAFDGIGSKRAESIRSEIGTPEEFVSTSREEHPNLPLFVSLDLRLLRSCDHIGTELASSIIDQIIEDNAR